MQSPSPSSYLAAGVIWLLALVTSPAQGIVVSASGAATAGGTFCVTVGSSGSSAQPTASAEIGGVALPPGSVTVTESPAGDGTWIVCVRIPSACAGATLTLTVAIGEEHTERKYPVGAQPLAPGN